jgi:chemotaxis signal transduction protein
MQTGSTQARYGFSVDRLRLTTPAKVMAEVVALATIFPLPKSAKALVGVINHRGSTVPVFDLSEAPPARAGLRRFGHDVLVLDRSERSVGIVLNASPELLELRPASRALEAPDSHLAPYLTSSWVSSADANAVWWDFDYESAISALARLN